MQNPAKDTAAESGLTIMSIKKHEQRFILTGNGFGGGNRCGGKLCFGRF